jgi:hypothetical protein
MFINMRRGPARSGPLYSFINMFEDYMFINMHALAAIQILGLTQTNL